MIQAFLAKALVKVGGPIALIAIAVIGTLVIEHKFFKPAPPQLKVNTEVVKVEPCPPCQAIDFKNAKNKGELHLTIKQYMTINGDSAIQETLRQMIREEIKKGFKDNLKGKFLQSSHSRAYDFADSTKKRLAQTDYKSLAELAALKADLELGQ